MNLQNYSLDEAADILRCKRRFLEDNLQRFPHQKLGQAVAFDEDELLAIKDSCRVHRTGVADHKPQELAGANVSALASLRPAQGRRRTG
ncbi:hypothetical protein [Streptomyces niveus]|uniref:hypothetical protein n=1 Tax=Streptomyces niveus TaxID=193462 RepID=UPI0035DCFF71